MRNSSPLDCDPWVRERILEAVAAEVTEKGGRGGLTLKTLVLRAKVSKSRFYRIFESGGMDEAFRAMLASTAEEVEERLAQAESLSGALDALLSWVDDHRNEAIAFLVWGYYEVDIFYKATGRFAALTGLPSAQGEGVVGGVASQIRKRLEAGDALDDDFRDSLIAFCRPYFEAVECP